MWTAADFKVEIRICHWSGLYRHLKRCIIPDLDPVYDDYY